MRRKMTITSLAAALLMLGSRLNAADFIRGDTNGDGKVSISDSIFLLNFLFRPESEAGCLSALDANGDRVIDISDAVSLLNSTYLGGPAILPPYPAPGPEPNPGGLDCGSYGGGSPLEDPAATLKVLDLVVPGGDQRAVLLNLAVSSTASTAGLSGSLTVQGSILREGRLTPRDLTGFPEEQFFRYADVRNNGRIEFATAYFSINGMDQAIPAGEDVSVLSLPLCLQPGTPAGEYTVTVTSGELIDSATGRSIVPALAGGTLRVLAEVTNGRCVPPLVEDPTVVFSLARASGTPGATVAVPFSIKASVPSQGFAFSVDYDEGALLALGVDKLWQKPSGTPYEFEKFEINDQNLTPGNAGTDEGYLVGAAVFSLTDSTDVIPPAKEVPVLNLRFRINSGTPPGSTPLVFLDGGEGSGGPVFNKLISGGKDITASVTGSFVFVNGVVHILPDGSVFVRGDSNGDGALDISDALATLDFLFLGGRRPRCYDAADSNDDGALDITDAVATLEALFLGAQTIPQPYPAPGADPTPDSMSCGSLGVI